MTPIDDESGEIEYADSERGEQQRTENLKRLAKEIGIPWQVMHGSAPQEMLDNPDAYHWDGSPKSTSFKRPDGEAGGGKLDVTKYFRNRQ